jgi:molecular chaperone GrpE
LFSEFDNYRKRTNKERLDLLSTAGEEIIISLLPVLDDFDRAITAMEKNGVTGIDLEGVKLIKNKLITILKKKGLEPLTAIGLPFDTDFHEALTSIPAPTEELKGKVVDEIEKGYLLNGKVIRFAKVVVGQ